MSGSATAVRWLLREGLLDELHLFVHPIVVGEGMARLFPADAPQAEGTVDQPVVFPYP